MMDLDDAEYSEFYDGHPMWYIFTEYGVRYPLQLVLGVTFAICSRFADILPPIILGVAIDAIFYQHQPYSLPIVPDSWLPSGQLGQFWFSVGLLGVAFFGGAVFHWLRNWAWNSFSQHIQHDLRTDCYEHVQSLSMAFYDGAETGDLLSILSNDINQLEEFLNEGMNGFFRMSVMVVGIAGFMIYLNWQLALIALVPIPLVGTFTYLIVRSLQPQYESMRASVGKLNSKLENNFSGMHIIKTRKTESHEHDEVRERSREYRDANWDAISTRILLFSGLRVFAGVGFVTTFVVGGTWLIRGTVPYLDGTITVGLLVTFLLYTERFIWPMSEFGRIVNSYQRARASTGRIVGLMHVDEAIEQREGAGELTVTDGEVAYDSVTFGYGDDEPVVEDVSLEIDSGQTAVFVGPTGAGKSTLLKLLLRIYDVDEGAVRIDDVDVRDVDVRSLRRSIAYVSQQTFLFDGTIEENIRYGHFDASEQAVRRAAKVADAHGFIEELPDGYDTSIGERGDRLSGGQRQRIAIARALLADTNVIALDEATSDMDTATEATIQNNLQEHAADRTVLMITHRLATAPDADVIFVVDEGRIVEAGTHEELLSNGDLYAELWDAQTSSDSVPRRITS